MLARLQQFITLGLLATAIAWAAWCVQRGHTTWAWAGAAVVVFGYAPFLAVELVLVWFVHGNDPAPKASPAQLFKAWWAEVLAAPRVFCWQQPFRSRREPDHLPATPSRRGVVLVHGFVCNRGFWNRWMPQLRAQGVPFIAVNLEPVFGTISDYVPIIEDAVQRLEHSTGQAPVLVGHSMGGLAIRAWYAASGAGRVHRIVTIGSPHRGTWLARFGSTQNAREMALGTDWQKALEALEPAQHFERFICFYSHCDNVVFPASTATLPGADNRHLVGMAHVHMVDHPLVLQAVLDTLTPAQ
ncbi:MAG: alpha/beta fold hydrolase [Rhizobacter sp.]|nr:alpha/beta fold hydrolase [Rhizobacter sp.]